MNMKDEEGSKARPKISKSKRGMPIKIVAINKPDIDLVAAAFLPLILDLHMKKIQGATVAKK